MDKNPFSLYDFMGYLFPGCLVLIIITYFYCLNFDVYSIVDLSNCNLLLEMGSKVSWESSLLLVVIGYAFGHIIAYMSSLTIETIFTNKIFGYPSDYLLNDRNRNPSLLFKRYFESDKVAGFPFLSFALKIVLKLMVAVLILPLFICVFSLGVLADINGFIVRPLDTYLQNTLKEKMYRLAEKLNIKHPDVNEYCDYHRIVMHYVYLNLPGSQKKTDNYMALYGFLRSITFIFCIIFFSLLIMALRTIDISMTIDWSIIRALMLLAMISYMVYLGFVKFYRRFTLENLMTLLVGMPNNENNSVEETL